MLMRMFDEDDLLLPNILKLVTVFRRHFEKHRIEVEKLKEKYNISRHEVIFLRAVAQQDKVPFNELHRKVNSEINAIKKSAISLRISGLEKKGLLKRTRSELDRRKVNVSLTKKGKELNAKIKPPYKKLRELLEILDKDDRDMLNNILEKIIQNADPGNTMKPKNMYDLLLEM